MSHTNVAIQVGKEDSIPAVLRLDARFSTEAVPNLCGTFDETLARHPSLTRDAGD